MATEATRKLVENAIYDARLILVEKCVRDVDVLIDGNARRNIAAIENFCHARAKNGAQDRIHADQPPTDCKLFVDQRINLALTSE